MGERLSGKAATASGWFHTLSHQIRQIETSLKTNTALKGAIVGLPNPARSTFDSILNGGKLPKIDKLKAEWQELTAKKMAAYKEYRAARSEEQRVLTVKANINALPGTPQQEKNKEQER